MWKAKGESVEKSWPCSQLDAGKNVGDRTAVAHALCIVLYSSLTPAVPSTASAVP